MAIFHGCFDIWPEGKFQMSFQEYVRRARKMGLTILLGRYSHKSWNAPVFINELAPKMQHKSKGCFYKEPQYHLAPQQYRPYAKARLGRFN